MLSVPLDRGGFGGWNLMLTAHQLSFASYTRGWTCDAKIFKIREQLIPPDKFFAPRVMYFAVMSFCTDC